MADDVAIKDAHGSVRRVSAHEDPGEPGLVTQRQLVQSMVDGDPVDVSPSDPLPVAGPLTNAQLRAAPVQVDTELPAAVGPSGAAVPQATPTLPVVFDSTNNLLRPTPGTKASGAGLVPDSVPASGAHLLDTTVSSALPARTARSLTDTDSGGSFGGAGNMLLRPDGSWARQKSADPAGGGLAATGVAAAAQHIWRPDINSQVPIVTASAVTDTEQGNRYPVSAGALYNGSTFERARAASREWVTLLPSAARSAAGNSPRIDIPGNLRGVAILMSVTSQSATGSVRPDVFSPLHNSTWTLLQAPVADAPLGGRTVTPGSNVDGQGASHVLMVVHPDASAYSPPGSWMRIQHHRLVVPPTLYVGVSPSDASSWTYSLHVRYLA